MSYTMNDIVYYTHGEASFLRNLDEVINRLALGLARAQTKSLDPIGNSRDSQIETPSAVAFKSL